MCCTQYASKFGKLSNGPRTGKGQFSSQSQRKAMPMLEVLHNYTHLTCYQSNTQNLQARLQQYMNHELPEIQARFRKGRGARDQIANIRWIIKNAREFQENIHFFFATYAKAFDCVDHNKLWKILKEMTTDLHPEKSVCRSRGTVRTGQGTTYWFQIGKGICQGYILSP